LKQRHPAARIRSRRTIGKAECRNPANKRGRSRYRFEIHCRLPEENRGPDPQAAS
jgi:hypothetical protein